MQKIIRIQIFLSNTENFQTALFDPERERERTQTASTALGWNKLGSNAKEEVIPPPPEFWNWILTTRYSLVTYPGFFDLWKYYPSNHSSCTFNFWSFYPSAGGEHIVAPTDRAGLFNFINVLLKCQQKGLYVLQLRSINLRVETSFLYLLIIIHCPFQFSV